MKKKYLFFELTAIFIFLIIPPLSVSPDASATVTVANNGVPSLWTLIQILTALLLHLQYTLTIQNKRTHFEKIQVMFRSLSWWAICLGLLLITHVLLSLAVSLLGIPGKETAFPEPGAIWAMSFLNLAVGAFYEESIYREFIPQALIDILPEKKSVRIFIELFCNILFAFSHRYMGLPAVSNAAICGAILRVCWKKSGSDSDGSPHTGSMYAGTAAHFAYNALFFFFASH